MPCLKHIYKGAQILPVDMVDGDADVFVELDAVVVIHAGLRTSYGGGSCAMDPVEWSYA